MQTENWSRLQNVWKGEKKPRVDIEELKAEVRKRKKRKLFKIVVETCIVVAVIIITFYRLTNQTNPFDYILLGQLWLITFLALTFNFWNRSSLKKAEYYTVAEYLKLLLNESVKKKRTAVFVFVLILLNLFFYIFLFLSDYIQFTDITTLVSAICLLLTYTLWSFWYYKNASSNISYYRKELRKIIEL